MLQQLKDPVHFVGIGGCGMSALAEYAQDMGLSVRGSDISQSETLERLMMRGIKCTSTHQNELDVDVKTVVVSSAISKDNPEVKWATKSGCQIVHRSDLLAFFMKGKKAITIAGTHGKTTTAALVAHALKSAGCDPSAIIGGVVRDWNASSRCGKGDCIVVEADESDGSFLKYHPWIGALTNVGRDHMEFFRDQDGLESAFLKYLENIHEEGTAIVGWDHPLSRKIGAGYSRQRLTYGFVLGSEVRATDYVCQDGKTSFTAIIERDQVRCSLNLIGRYNVANALCAFAVARALGLDVKKVAESLTHFAGVDRRFSVIYESKTVRIIDDYAHNPGKLASSVQAVKESWPKSKLIVVFQPHRFTRLETMYNELMVAFKGADEVLVLPVYSAGEVSTRDFEVETLARDLEESSHVVSRGFKTKDHVVQFLLAHISKQEGQTFQECEAGQTIVLTLGAGDVWKIARTLGQALKDRLEGRGNGKEE